MARHELPAGPGRPKGSLNKMAKEAKEIVEWIHAALQDGRGPYDMLRWARENPEAFYTKIWVKLLPSNANLNVKGNGGVIINLVSGIPLREDEIEHDRQKAARLAAEAEAKIIDITPEAVIDTGDDLV